MTVRLVSVVALVIGSLFFVTWSTSAQDEVPPSDESVAPTPFIIIVTATPEPPPTATLVTVPTFQPAGATAPSVTPQATSNAPAPEGLRDLQANRWRGAPVQVVPRGQVAAFAVPYIVCRYPRLNLECSLAAEPREFAEISVVDVRRDAAEEMRQRMTRNLSPTTWERYRPEPGEEAVFIKLRVTYVRGQPGSSLTVGSNLFDSSTPFITMDGRVGREGPSSLGLPEPELLDGLRIGSSTEGWVSAYIPAGAALGVVVDAHSRERYVLAAE